MNIIIFISKKHTIIFKIYLKRKKPLVIKVKQIKKIIILISYNFLIHNFRFLILKLL